jgi:4'-phosphopantetheinyl transferase
MTRGRSHPGAPDVPPLRDAEVHVWTMRLDASLGALAELEAGLSSAERDAHARYVRPRDRAMFALSHATRRALLGAYVGVSPGALTFATGEHGKPRLDGTASDVRFNVSHSGDVALLAVARGKELGVDVEEIRASADLDAIARAQFSPREQSDLRRAGASDEARVRSFFACWSRKEAVIKAIGLGLAFPLAAFDVAVDPDAPPRLLASRDARLDAAVWSMHPLRIPAGHAGALMVEGRVAVVRELLWPHA